MKHPHSPDMTSKFKAIFARLKSRRRADSTRSRMAAAAVTAACESNSTDIDPEVERLGEAIDDMDITAPPSLPIAPSGTFDFRPPAPSPEWPGPRYDDLIQFVPGIFNQPRDTGPSKGKGKQKRTVIKRSSSHDDKHVPRRPSSKVTKAPTPTNNNKSVTTPKKPQFCRSPPRRAEPLHLLGLPGEIRNQIYRYLYLSKEPLNAQYRPIIRPHQKTARPVVKRFPREPTLALVCKQLRNEASSLFYAENTFVFATGATLLGGAFVQSMTTTRSLTDWMTASSFTKSLSCIELCLGRKGGPDAYAREGIKYVFRRLADGSTEVRQDLESVARCTCLDTKLLTETIPEIAAKNALGAENLLHAAIALVAKRNAMFRGIMHVADSEDCKGCEKPGWRRLEQAVR